MEIEMSEDLEAENKKLRKLADDLGTALSDLMLDIVEANIDVSPFRKTSWDEALRIYEEWVSSIPDDDVVQSTVALNATNYRRSFCEG